MTNIFYNPTGNPVTGSKGIASLVAGEFAAIGVAFDMVPAISTTGLFATVFNQVGSFTFTLPGAPGTLATLAGTETLTNKTLVAPALGTPASGVATNLTGTAAGLTAGNVTTNANLTGPIASAGNATSIVSQTGTGTTFVMSANPSIIGANLNTPSAAVLTNASGTAAGLTAGNVTTNANLTGPIASVGNATSIVAQTGTGTTFVMSASPNIVSPNLNTPSAINLTNATGTAAAVNIGGNAATATTATNVAGGAGGAVPYQSAANTTALLANGAARNLLVSQGGALAPQWTAETYAVPGAAGRLLTSDGTNWTSAVPAAAAAGTLTGATLAAGVTASSLTSFGAAPALGTPASGVVTNLTGTAAGVSIGGNAATATTATSATTATNVAGAGTVGAATGTFTGLVTAANGTSGTQVVNFSQFPTTTSASADKVALPGGTFWQAGTGTDNGAGVTITFPTAFPTQCTSFVAVIRLAAGPVPVGAVTGTRSTTGCAVWAFNTTTGNAFGVENFDWIAEGH